MDEVTRQLQEALKLEFEPWAPLPLPRGGELEQVPLVGPTRVMHEFGSPLDISFGLGEMGSPPWVGDGWGGAGYMTY